MNLTREMIVAYPVVEPTEQFLEVLPMVTGELESFVRGRGYDLYRIRDYMPEDSARHVDWKATARTGALKVREYSREDERRLRIIFDNPAPGILKPPSTSEPCGWRLRWDGTFITKMSKSPSSHRDLSRPLTSLFSAIPGAGRAAGSDSSVQSAAGRRGLQRDR